MTYTSSLLSPGSTWAQAIVSPHSHTPTPSFPGFGPGSPAFRNCTSELWEGVARLGQGIGGWGPSPQCLLSPRKCPHPPPTPISDPFKVSRSTRLGVKFKDLEPACLGVSPNPVHPR